MMPSLHKQLQKHNWLTYSTPETPLTLGSEFFLPTEIWMYIFAYCHPMNCVALWFVNIEILVGSQTVKLNTLIESFLARLKRLICPMLPDTVWYTNKNNTSSMPSWINVVTNVPLNESLKYTHLPVYRKWRVIDTLTFLGLVCHRLTVLYLPQSGWIHVNYVTNEILQRFLNNNLNLQFLDVSGLNIKSKHLIKIFSSKSGWGSHLKYLKFSGEHKIFRQPSLIEYCLDSNNDTLVNFVRNLRFSTSTHSIFRICNEELRTEPIRILKTLPETPTRLYCTTEDHGYCCRCFRIFCSITYSQTKYVRYFCQCIKKRLKNEFLKHGRNYSQFCECTLTFLRYSIRCRNFFNNHSDLEEFT